jgi:HlyD family secretion protein
VTLVKNKVLNKTKLLIKVILAFIGISLLIFAFIPEKVKVDIIKIQNDNILITMEGEGKTRIHDIYTVSTPIDGRVTRIESEAGDFVTAGSTIIANMYPANPLVLDKRLETQAKADIEGARAALSLANARVKQAEAQLQFDLSDFKRTQELFKTDNVSQSTLERAELRLKTLHAELETAQSNKAVMISRLEAAKAMLLQPVEEGKETNESCHICIHSPVDGRVLRILHKSESIVPVGTALVEIGNPADLEVKIEMLSTNAVKVKVGDGALINRWGGIQDINAVVKVIEPSGFTKISALGVEEQRVNIILSFTDPIEKWKSLGDAFRVEAAIIIDRADNVLTVPLSALFRQNEVWSVFKVVDGVVFLQAVTILRRNDRKAQIGQGLNSNDQVILHPSNNIDEGTRVEIM